MAGVGGVEGEVWGEVGEVLWEAFSVVLSDDLIAMESTHLDAYLLGSRE